MPRPQGLGKVVKGVGATSQPSAHAELLELRHRAAHGINHVSQYLKASGFPIQPAHNTKLALNVVFHVFILFMALTLLYMFVVAPKESSSLQKEVDREVASAVHGALASQSDQAKVRALLKGAEPALTSMKSMYVGKDPARVAENKTTIGLAWAIIAGLAITFAVSVVILVHGSGVDMGKPVAHIVGENVIVFLIVGAAEYLFFKYVGSTFIPVKPSTVSGEALKALQHALS